MVKVIRIMVAIAFGMLIGTALPAHAASSHGDQPHRAVCGAVPAGKARCNAEIVTDAQGNPLVASAPVGFGPAQLHGGYNLPCSTGGTAPLASCGSKFTYNGSQIIAIVDAFNDPTIAQDVNIYSKQYGISPCPFGPLVKSTSCLSVTAGNGTDGLPKTDLSWAEEISLDVETVHQICQTCKILLVEAKDA
jgi:subtilase family serine protease